MPHPLKIQEIFRESGHYDIFPEFVETLVNDESIPRKLRRAIWTLASTNWEDQLFVCAVIAASFQDSEDETDLTTKWTALMESHWPSFPDCILKREIDLLKS